MKTRKLLVPVLIILCLVFFTTIETVCAAAEASTDSRLSYENTSSDVLRGNIVDEQGLPLPGVSVYIEGTTIGVISDINGNYELTLPKGENILVNYSFLGYNKEIFVFNGETDVYNLQMTLDSTILDDVVVIGYGQKSKKSLTSAISSIDKNQLEKLSTVSTTIDNMVGGAIKGVLLRQSSGELGSTASINIRGITSPFPNLTSDQSTNTPLYVIDGVPMFMENSNLNPLLSIAPADIESIDVLKDAAATAIYGSRGANGVIIVNTKKGRKGENIAITANYIFSIGNPIKEIEPLSIPEFKQLQDVILKGTVPALNEWRAYPSIDVLRQFGDITGGEWDPATYQMTPYKYNGLLETAFGDKFINWNDAIRNKNATSHQYNVSLRGGTQVTDYSFSLNANNQEGLFINDKMDRYSSRLTLNSNVTERMKIGGSISYSNTTKKGATQSTYFTTPVWSIRPDVPIYDKLGDFQRIDGSALYGTAYLLANPVAKRQLKTVDESNQFLGTAYLEYELLKGLKFRGDISLSDSHTENSRFEPLVAKDVLVGNKIQSELVEAESQYTRSSVNFRLDYTLRKGEHSYTAMLGYGADRTKSKSKSHYYEGFPNDKYMTNMGAAKSVTSYNDNSLRNGLNSVYSRFSYDYARKYLAELSFRGDKSSKFGPENKWAYFPALSLGWRISEEEFIRNREVINDLKLRLSVGRTGSTNVPDFAYQQHYLKNSYAGELALALKKMLPNRDVRWELTSEYNFGVDFSFFENRLYGSFDAYYRYTDGALALAPYVNESGMTSYYSNIIDVSNRGFELELGGTIISTDKFNWKSVFNISKNKNRVEHLNNAVLESSSFQDSFIVGYPAGTLKGYKVEKIIQTQKEIDDLNAKAVAEGKAYYQAYSYPGDYLMKDINGDGIITRDDRVVLATPEPKFFGGWNNTFTYDRFSLSFLMQFSQGSKAIWNSLMMNMSGILGMGVSREVLGNTWTPDNPDARYPQLIAMPASEYNLQTSDRYLFDASYLRMKNLTFSYNLGENLLKRIRITNASVFVTATNLFTLTKWPGVDPELLGSEGTGIGGMTVNYDPYPLSRTISVGVSLSL